MSSLASPRCPSALRLVLGGSMMVLFAAGCQGGRAHAPAAPAPDRMNVGYGALPRSAVTGAIESATAEELAERKVSRVEETFEGRFAGLDVARLNNGQYSLRIRGGRGEPLIVIDGIPSPMGLTNPLQDLAPGSIASVSVLKDAGSTAAYGVRGANGVILITMRRGR